MKRSICSAWMVAMFATTMWQGGKPASAGQNERSSRFDRFKALAGDWEGHALVNGKPDGPATTVRFKVTSGGSAVVETDSPDTDEEMFTVIHRDGNAVALTHYCHMGNQPHMVAPDAGDSNMVPFKFASATNLKSPSAAYMRSVTYTFVDADTLKEEWTLYSKGKSAGSAAFLLTRKK